MIHKLSIFAGDNNMLFSKLYRKIFDEPFGPINNWLKEHHVKLSDPKHNLLWPPRIILVFESEQDMIEFKLMFM